MLALMRRMDALLEGYPLCGERKGCLGARLEYESSKLELQNAGDDGVIFRVVGSDPPVCIKVFELAIGDYYDGITLKEDTPEFEQVKRAINTLVRDQATRELEALKLLSSHPYFPRVYSDEVDTLDDIEINDASGRFVRKVKPAYAIKMEYIDNAFGLSTITHMLGLRINLADDSLEFDFGLRNDHFKAICQQLFQCLVCFKEFGIEHRDLDACNVLLRMTDLQLFVVDFARANIKTMSKFETLCLTTSMGFGYNEGVGEDCQKIVYDRVMNSTGRLPVGSKSDSDAIPRLLRDIYLRHTAKLSSMYIENRNDESRESIFENEDKRLGRIIAEISDVFNQEIPSVPDGVEKPCFQTSTNNEQRLEWIQALTTRYGKSVFYLHNKIGEQAALLPSKQPEFPPDIYHTTGPRAS